MIPTKKLKRWPLQPKNKIKNDDCLLGWIPFALLLSSFRIKSVTAQVTALPTCYVADNQTLNTNAICAKDGNENFTANDYCISSSVIHIAAAGSCSPVTVPSGGKYFVFVCSAAEKCVAATSSLSGTILMYYCSSGSNCELNTKKGYLINPDSTVVADAPLIKVDTAVALVAKAAVKTDAYYVDLSTSDGAATPSYKKLINCSSTTSCTSTPISKDNVGYYIDAADVTKIIYCENASGTIKCSSSAHQAADNAPKHYLDAATKRVITCVVTDGCTLEDASIKGYFINSGKTNSLIKCNGSSCEVVTTSNKKAGGYSIVTSGTAGIYLCLTDNCTTDTTERVKIEIANSGTTFVSFHHRGQKCIPGVDKDGSAFLLEAASLPTCSSTANTGPCKVGGKSLENGVYCISSNKIYVGTDGNCGLLNNSQAEDKVFYFGPDNKAPSDPTSDPTSMAYICTFTGGTPALESCKIAKGYTYSSSKQVICSGWKKDTCTVITTPDTCTSKSDGSLTSTKMCISQTEKYTLPTSAGTSYTAYNTNDISSIYGKNKNEIVFIGITYADSAVQSAIVVPNKKGYFVNLSVFGTTKDALINCKEANNLAKCVVEDAKMGYYLHGDDPDKLIKCTGSGCEELPITSSNLEYYINATKKTDLINCAGATVACSSKAHKGTGTAQVHYLGAGGTVITCTKEGCIEEDASIKGYFINAATTDDTDKIIACDGSTCAGVAAASDCTKAGNFIIDGSNVSICTVAGDDAPVKLESSDSGEAVFKSITIAAANDFPGATASSTIDVKIGKDGSAILLEDTSLPECTTAPNGSGACDSSGSSVNLCYRTDSGVTKIYKTVGTTCVAISGTDVGVKAAKTAALFFNSKFELVDGPEAGKSIPNVMAYQCTFKAPSPFTLEKCNFIKGYAIDATNAVRCSGWKREGCTVTAKSSLGACAAGNEGSLGSAGLCFGSTAHGSAILLEDTSLPECTTAPNGSGACDSSGSSVNLCYRTDSGVTKIYKTVGTTCVAISGTDVGVKAAKTAALFFNSKFELVDGPEAGKSIPNVMAYQCTFKAPSPFTLEKCNFIKGYAIDATNAVRCSGWKREGCTVTAKSSLGACAAGNEGSLGSAGLCFGSTARALPTSASTVNKVAFLPTKYSTIYGVSSVSPSFLTISSTSIFVTASNDDAITVGYHKNVNAEGTKENALIQCTTAKTLNSCKSLNALNGYYLNAATDKAQNQIIKCSGTGCAVDKVSATTCGKAGTLIKDKDNTTTIKLCKVDAAKDDDIIAIAASATTYETLTVKANNFPNATTDGKIAVKIGTDGSVTLLEEDSLPTCDTTKGTSCMTGHPEKACLSSGKIYMSCYRLRKKTFYFNSNYESVAAGVGANIAYQCTFDDNGAVKSCELVKGYVQQGTSFLQCNGWKGEVCAAPSTTACANDMNGEMESTNKSICFTSNDSIDITTLTGESKIAFELTKTSNIYGEKEGDVVVLSLSATEAVVTTLDTENTRYFVNQNTAEDKEIIKCGGDGCASEPKKIGFYLEGGSEEKVSESVVYSKLISCDGTSCTAAAPTVTGYYVDASSAKEEKGKDEEDNEITLTTYEKLILCEEDENNDIKCKSVASVASGYYLNAKPDGTNKFTDALIKCSGTDSMTCKLYKVENENSIYINNADKGIIQCISDSDGCVGVDADTKEALYGTEKIPFYYVNSDDTVTDATRIIKCIGVGQCEVMPAAPNDIFLNGNLQSSDNTKGEVNVPLILCSEEGCTFGVSGPKNAGTEYYINAGVNEGDGGEVNPIIKCDSDGTAVTCEAAPAPGTSETFFINGNYENDKKNLLKCKSNECEGYGEAKAEGIENYIHGAATDLTDAIIECTLTEDPDNEGEFLASCAFPATAPEAGNVYLNSFNRNLIQCTDAECTDFDKVVGTTDIPAYFVNGDRTTEDDDYKGLLIQCTGTGTCAAADGAEFNVYVNGNFRDDTVNVNGDDTNRLIICSDSKCEPTNNDSVGEGKRVYYVNGGIVPSNVTPYKNALIQCGSSEACDLVDAGEDYLYVNSNTIDSDNFLIYCNAGQCEPISGAPEGDESEFYINFGTTSTDKLIECTGDGFKNKNYGEDNDPVNYLIRCTADDCVPYGTENPVAGAIEYYVNHAQSDLSDAVIKIEFSDGTGTGRKRGTGVTASISYVEDIEENDIFLNSSTQKLIQCSDEKCEAFEGTGSANIPAYYINAAAVKNDDFTDFIIKCTDEKCSIENGHANDVYLNANLQDTENSETGERTPEKSDVEGEAVEFFINSGEYNDGTDDYALIKCTGGEPATCQSEKVTLAEGVSEVFYKNANYGSDRDAINYLIGCTSTTTCTPTRNSEAAVGTEHYVHGAAEALTNAIIECTLSAATRRRGEGDEEGDDTEDPQEQAPNLTATCSIIETAKAGNIYIDSSKPVQVIKCTEEGCTAEATTPTPKISQFFLHENEEGSMELIQCVVTDGCSLYREDISEGNKVFLNANYGPSTDATNQLIKCSHGACELAPSEANTEKPEYYVNGDATDTDPFHCDIIQCEQSDDTGVTCHLLDSADRDKVYLNADFSATNAKQLI
ncbi:hypothetical protein PIROE2DRAFT_3256, partial [Piromyces sp. E2]